jgi:hypothetical protein
MPQVELPSELNRVCDEIEDCSRRHAEAIAAQLRAQARVDELRARLAVDVRRRIEKGDRRAAEKTVEALVVSDDSYLEARRRAVEAEIDRVRMQSRLDALMARKDILLWTVAS